MLLLDLCRLLLLILRPWFAASDSFFSVFNKANTNIHGQDDSVLDKDEFRSFFRKIMNDKYSDEAADEAFGAIDADGNSEITISEFKEGILKSNKNTISGMPRKCIIVDI